MKALTSLPEGANAPESLPLSLLNDFLYCPRRAGSRAVRGRGGRGGAGLLDLSVFKLVAAVNVAPADRIYSQVVEQAGPDSLAL